MRRWGIVLFILAALAVAAYFGGPVVRDVIVRGRRLTRATDQWDDSDDLTIAEDPEDLAAEAGAVVGDVVSVDEYALARMARSEQPRGTDDVKAALMHVALNDAAAHGWSLLYTLTVSTKQARTGYFGNQTSRRYSTKDDPFDLELAIARRVLAERAQGIDRASGAVKFVDVNAFKPGVYDATAAKWAAEGLRPFTIDGLPSDQVFFRRGAA